MAESAVTRSVNPQLILGIPQRVGGSGFRLASEAALLSLSRSVIAQGTLAMFNRVLRDAGRVQFSPDPSFRAVPLIPTGAGRG